MDEHIGKEKSKSSTRAFQEEKVGTTSFVFFDFSNNKLFAQWKTIIREKKFLIIKYIWQNEGEKGEN